MNLTADQRNVLLALTPEWLSSAQIAEQLPKESGNRFSVNQSLKELVKAGLAQGNSVVFGLYRLTADGTNLKEQKSAGK